MALYLIFSQYFNLFLYFVWRDLPLVSFLSALRAKVCCKQRKEKIITKVQRTRNQRLLIKFYSASLSALRGVFSTLGRVNTHKISYFCPEGLSIKFIHIYNHIKILPINLIQPWIWDFRLVRPIVFANNFGLKILKSQQLNFTPIGATKIFLT